MATRAYYTVAASYYHWIVGTPMLLSIGSVLKAQQSPKEEKGIWMFRHKSLGLLSGILVAPRLGYRLFNTAKFHLRPFDGAGHVEKAAGKASHYALYAFMTVMPATGIAMGYYGGKGLPFFYTTIPGAETPNGAIAKQSFSLHTSIGNYGKYLIPLHTAGAVSHVARGHTIFARVNPFRSPKH